MIEFFPVNPLVVIISAAASMLVGFIWFSPFLFLNQWQKAVGTDQKNYQAKEAQLKRQKPAFAWMFLLAVLTSYILAILFTNFSVVTTWDGIVFTFWVWLAFVLPVIAGNVFALGQPYKLIFLEGLRTLITLAVVGAILGTWY